MIYIPHVKKSSGIAMSEPRSVSAGVLCCCGWARVAAQITAQCVLCCRLQLATVTTTAEGIVLCTAQRCWSIPVPKQEFLGGAGSSAFGNGEELKGLLNLLLPCAMSWLTGAERARQVKMQTRGLLLFPVKGFFDLP